MTVVDYTTRIAPAALKAAGVTGVCRYLSWLPNPKVITQAEYHELAPSFDITLNWEFRGTDWTGGAATAQLQATEAVRQARALGYPQGHVIPGSADFDMTSAGWVAYGRLYATHYAAIIRDGGYRPGVYGSYDLINWISRDYIMDAFWQSMSTSFSGGRNTQPHPATHLWQRRRATIGGVQVDVNDILKQPLWGSQKEHNMFMAKSVTDPAIRLSDGFKWKHLGFPEYTTLKGIGVTLATVADIPALDALTGVEWTATQGGPAVLVPHTHHVEVTGSGATGPAGG